MGERALWNATSGGTGGTAVFVVNHNPTRAELGKFGLTILGGLAVIGGLLWYWGSPQGDQTGLAGRQVGVDGSARRLGRQVPPPSPALSTPAKESAL